MLLEKKKWTFTGPAAVIQLPGEPEGPNSKGCFGKFQEKSPLAVHCDLRLPIHGTNFCDPWIKLCPGIFSQVSVQAL